MAGEPATEATLNPEATRAFQEGLRGPVLRPGDPGYDDARALWNGLIDRRPALIVQCSGAADVVDAVNFAREQNLLVSIKGGGHNVAGNAVNDGGLVIDLSQMRGVHVDPSTQTVRAQGGATWGDTDREAQLFGLAVPGGVVSTTGIAGLTLHGGVGHLRRKHGLSIDSLRSVDIVTAEWQLRKGERNRERGPLLGRTRRGQQLRSRHVVRVPGAPGWPDGDGRRGLLPAGGGEGNRARVARLRGLGARGAELDRAVLERSTARAVSARAPRQARRGRRRRLLGIGRRRRAGRAALARAGGAADRPERPVALARPAERFRCALSQGSVLLLEIAGLRRAA